MRITSWVCLTIFVITLFLSIGITKDGTYAWFVSETQATGTMTNATTADLLTVTATHSSCEKNADTLEITLTNTSDVIIPVETAFFSGDMAPKTSVTRDISAEKAVVTQTIDVHVIGFHHFIDDVFHVDVTNLCT